MQKCKLRRDATLYRLFRLARASANGTVPMHPRACKVQVLSGSCSISLASYSDIVQMQRMAMEDVEEPQNAEKVQMLLLICYYCHIILIHSTGYDVAIYCTSLLCFAVCFGRISTTVSLSCTSCPVALGSCR